MTLFDTAAELSATAADIAHDLTEDRACPAHVARARGLLDTLAAEIGDTDDPAPYTLTPKALAALAEHGDLPPVVCLCGSTRFYDEFQQAAYDLTMRGEIVLSVGFYPHATARHGHGEGIGHDSAAKAALDELHKRKIDLADYVLVINPGGYVGLSTRSEIAYAAAHGKPVVYLQTGATDARLTAEYQAAELFDAACRGNLR